MRVLNSGVNANAAFVVAEILNIGTAASTATIAKLESEGQEIGTASVKPPATQR